MTKNRRTTHQKSLNRRLVASGILAGQTTKTIARDARISTRTVQRLAVETDTQLLITEAFRPFHAQLRRMAGRAVKVIDEAMGALKADPQDYISRLKAVEQFGQLLSLAQGKLVDPPAEDKKLRQMTWEEFSAMYHARNPDPSKEPFIGSEIVIPAATPAPVPPASLDGARL